MRIKKNTICYASEVGHNNFHYPSDNKLIIKEEYSADVIPWISGGSKIAFRVPKNLLENTKLNILQPPNNKIIVWIDKCLLN